VNSRIVMKPTGLPLQEREQTCEACGAQGTVGRAFRSDVEGNPTEMHRFCARCWPEESARLRELWEDTRSSGTGMGFESATWDHALELVRHRELRASASEHVGEMPLEIEAFIREHSGDT
jgi:hypothetical protein